MMSHSSSDDSIIIITDIFTPLFVRDTVVLKVICMYHSPGVHRLTNWRE